MIHDLYLLTGSRGKGESGRLLDLAEAWLMEQRVTMVECQVVLGNALGAAFWEKRGYAPVSTVRGKRLPPEEDDHVVSPD